MCARVGWARPTHPHPPRKCSLLCGRLVIVNIICVPTWLSPYEMARTQHKPATHKQAHAREPVLDWCLPFPPQVSMASTQVSVSCDAAGGSDAHDPGQLPSAEDLARWAAANPAAVARAMAASRSTTPPTASHGSRQAQAAVPARGVGTSVRRRYTCGLCGGEGHNRRSCPQAAGDGGGGAPAPRRVQGQRRSMRSVVEFVGHVARWVFFDFEVCCVHHTLRRNCRSPPEPARSPDASVCGDTTAPRVSDFWLRP